MSSMGSEDQGKSFADEISLVFCLSLLGCLFVQTGTDLCSEGDDLLSGQQLGVFSTVSARTAVSPGKAAHKFLKEMGTYDLYSASFF